MIKRRLFSAHNDMKTGFFYKFFIILGIALLVIAVLQYAVRSLSLNEATDGAILAFGILCIGGGCLLYFFSRQFAKLSSIADDIEHDETLVDDEEETKEK
jgi:hypothetical protein